MSNAVVAVNPCCILYFGFPWICPLFTITLLCCCSISPAYRTPTKTALKLKRTPPDAQIMFREAGQLLVKGRTDPPFHPRFAKRVWKKICYMLL